MKQSKEKGTIENHRLPYQKDLTVLSKGCQICHLEKIRPVSGRKIKFNTFHLKIRAMLPLTKRELH